MEYRLGRNLSLFDKMQSQNSFRTGFSIHVFVISGGRLYQAMRKVFLLRELMHIYIII